MKAESYANELSFEMYKKLVNNRYSRNKPTRPLEIVQRITTSILENRTITLAGLWGGSKEGICGNDADINSLDFIAGIRDELKSKYSQLELSLLFCDIHHVLANGIPYTETEEYYSVLAPLARKRNMGIVRLSEVLGKGGIESYTNPESEEKAKEIMKNQNVLERLKRAAKKHSRNTNKLPEEEIIKMYLSMEIFFLHKLDRQDIIFFSFSNPLVQKSIAEHAKVPMLYLHADINRHHYCPWYS
jgi:hypothetical protein